MEYSPMLVLMLWALTPSDCWPTSGEQARVVEMPQPIMSVHPEGGYFTFNHGRPFLAERDPLTGAIDSNLKTTPVTSDDYLYEEYEESGESIDRKDSTKIYTRNDITSSSKESDLHKFLNLPVHYSSSGKFPLISSSYANTKIQGHGPLSNHKLYSTSTSTTSTVSPTYYPLKTTATPMTTPKLITKATTVTITTRPTTTTSATTTTRPTIQPSTLTTPLSTTTSAPTRAPSTKPTTIFKTTKPTTTSKPFLSNYEYEYDYEYDNENEKGGTEGTEKSQDYEFLGASSEVTKTEEKLSNTQASSPTYIVSSVIKEQTTKLTTTVSETSTTSRPSTQAVNISKTTTKSPSEQHHDVAKKPPTVSSNANQEDIVDLRPPKPDLAVDLRPPQLQPTRPYSSVVPSKHQENFSHLGFVRYPETPLMVDDKKPISVYSPQNFSKTKPEIDSTHQSNPSNTHEDKQDSSASYSTHIIHTNPPKRNGVEASIVVAMASQDNTKFGNKNENNNNNQSSFQDKNYDLKNKDRPYSTSSTDKTRPETSFSSSLNSEKQKQPTEMSTKPEENTLINGNKPENVITAADHNREELMESNKHPSTTTKTDYMRPQGVQLEHSKLPVAAPSTNSRPQEYYYSPVQGHAKPPTSYEHRPQAILSSEHKMTQKPQATTTENSRLQIQIKPDNRPVSVHLPENRPQNSHLPHNNNPHEHIHYSIEHNRPPNYQPSDPNRPQNHIFGLRITERPRLPERPSLGIDYSRPPPHGVRIPESKPHDQKKPVGGIEMRPPQNVMNGAEARPQDSHPKPAETNAKPVIFSKPQSGKKPDYNTVQFGQPSKVENHFISVSPGQENPSYSLQTSFSIGVPPPEQKQHLPPPPPPPPAPATSGVHGVGQVLFPDDEPEKRPPVWQHQRPPLISHPDPHPNIQLEKYPRPPWESHLKPPHVYHKKEPFPPLKRKPLPNILPQFRPNAKIGHAEPHIYLKPREPYDTLQPPPLPRPQFLRLEQELEETKPLVHRRNGQTSTRVTTLQMMQGSPAAKRASLRIEDNNENEPVFVVYPSNGNNPPSPPSDGVVVGTRGPQRPLPPDNLDIGDDLDSFPLDNNKNFQARVDTPVLKSKPSTSKPVIKNEFPYALIKPNPEEQTPAGEVTKEYTAFSPTVPSTEKEHDTEINIIPYLQDYMPFATKKPQHKDSWILGGDIKHLTAPTVSTKPANIEITQSPYKNENHRVVVSEGPQPQDFQAPFHASLTAPSQGWSVVQKKPNKEKNTEETTTSKEMNEVQTTVEPKFDIQNFKPQLFGGFKPIVPPIDENKKSKMNR